MNSTSNEAPQTNAQRCVTEPDRLLQAHAALGGPNQSRPLCRSKGSVASGSGRPGSDHDCGLSAGMRPLWRPKIGGARPATWCLFCMAAQMAEMPQWQCAHGARGGADLRVKHNPARFEQYVQRGPAGPRGRAQTKARGCVTEPDRLLQAHAALADLEGESSISAATTTPFRQANRRPDSFYSFVDQALLTQKYGGP